MTNSTTVTAVTSPRTGIPYKADSLEKLETVKRRARYKSLTHIITNYQIGKGPAPTDAQFNQWLDDLEHAVKLRTMMIEE